MNNATRESSVPPIPESHQTDQDDPEGQELASPVGREKEISDVLRRLDELRYAPRAEAVRAIMEYAHKNDEAIH
jgi:hypothetical protein